MKETERARFREHPLEFSLGLFADVRAGEAITTLVLTGTVFLLLLAYYLLKVAREPLILAGGGAEVKSYAAAGQSVLLIGFSFAYGAIAKLVSRIRLVVSVSLFFISNLVLFWFLAATKIPLGVPFYLWVGIFNMSVIAQFWGFAADILGDDRGKRLFPVLGIGSSLGAVAGSAVAGALVKMHLGPRSLMGIAAGILLVCVLLNVYVETRERKAPAKGIAATTTDAKAKQNGFSMLLGDRYLMYLGIFAIVLNAVNSTGEYVLDRTLVEASKAEADPKAFIGAFKATYFVWVNAIGVGMQMFAVSRILKRVGVERALFLMPIVSFGGYLAIGILPVLNLVFGAKVAENSLDYSLENTSRQSLWLPTTSAEKYSAKQVIDTFLVRLGDVASAGIVLAGGALHFATRHFALLNVGLVLAWFGVLVPLVAEYKKRVVVAAARRAAQQAAEEAAAAAASGAEPA